jgi:hypothetical protein
MTIDEPEIRRTVDWLLEKDDPGVRYLALRDICRDSAAASKERRLAHSEGPISNILARMNAGGFWRKPGIGYSPKYTSTIWSVIHLAQLGGAIASDRRIGKACTYLLDHAFAEGGRFTLTGAPSGTVDCLQGNLCWALTELGCTDGRLRAAYEWMARTVTGEGVAPAANKHAGVRYFAAKCGPDFACGYNDKHPCAWGAVKVLGAFGAVPESERIPEMRRAVKAGVRFLFGVDPATAAYPAGKPGKPNPNWWKFGFPVFYITDVLQILEVMNGLGYGKDRRAENLAALVEGKRTENGRWLLEYDYSGKIWVGHGKKGKPNKWVTLRALRGLGIGR